MKSSESIVAKQVLYQQWAQDVRDCNARPEGVTVREWCKAHDIKVSTYYFRLKALRAAYIDAFAAPVVEPVNVISEIPGPSFVELSPKNDIHSEPSHATIRIGSVSIDIDESIDDSFLQRIIEVCSYAK